MGNKLKNNVNICCQPREYIIEGNMPAIEQTKAKNLIDSYNCEANDFSSKSATIHGK